MVAGIPIHMPRRNLRGSKKGLTVDVEVVSQLSCVLNGVGLSGSRQHKSIT